MHVPKTKPPFCAFCVRQKLFFVLLKKFWQYKQNCKCDINFLNYWETHHHKQYKFQISDETHSIIFVFWLLSFWLYCFTNSYKERNFHDKTTKIPADIFQLKLFKVSSALSSTNQTEAVPTQATICKTEDNEITQLHRRSILRFHRIKNATVRARSTPDLKSAPWHARSSPPRMSAAVVPRSRSSYVVGRGPRPSHNTLNKLIKHAVSILPLPDGLPLSRGTVPLLTRRGHAIEIGGNAPVIRSDGPYFITGWRKENS